MLVLANKSLSSHYLFCWIGYYQVMVVNQFLSCIEITAMDHKGNR